MFGSDRVGFCLIIIFLLFFLIVEYYGFGFNKMICNCI